MQQMPRAGGGVCFVFHLFTRKDTNLFYWSTEAVLNWTKACLIAYEFKMSIKIVRLYFDCDFKKKDHNSNLDMPI